MGKVIPFYKNRSEDIELILKVINIELARIKTLMFLNKEDRDIYLLNVQMIFGKLRSIFRKATDFNSVINTLDLVQVEFIVSAFQLQTDEMDNNEITLQVQEIYFKFVERYTELAHNHKKTLIDNYYMYFNR